MKLSRLLDLDVMGGLLLTFTFFLIALVVWPKACEDVPFVVRIVAVDPQGPDNWFGGSRPPRTTLAFPDGHREIVPGTFGAVGETFTVQRRVCR